MPTNSDVSAMPDLLRRLAEMSPPHGRVLSVYLDTSPERLLGLDYLTYFRDGCKALRARLSPAESKSFEAAAMQAEQYLTKVFTPNRAGVALFATGDPAYFYAVPLPKAPLEGVIWDERPILAPLYEMLDEFERVAVLLFDAERARLLIFYLGEIEREVGFQDAVPGKQATGEWFGLAQTRFARHREEHVMRHAQRAAEAAMAELVAHPFDRLILGGPAEAIAILKPHLPRPLRSRLAGTIRAELFESDASLREKALLVMEARERDEERVEVQQLLEAVVTRHAVVGAEATLTALGTGQVHRLLLTEDTSWSGGACEQCGRLATGGERCASCGGEVTPVTELRERIVAQALAQGAQVEFVSGEAAAMLVTEGGLGAWTRF